MANPFEEIKDLIELDSTSHEAIAEQLGYWAEIFSDGMIYPEKLAEECYQKMGIFHRLLQLLITAAADPNDETTKDLFDKLKSANSKLVIIRRELPQAFNKKETPKEDVLDKVPELFKLLIELKNQYNKLAKSENAEQEY